ncbi:CrcB family protein [Myxococcota bacterium]|nr:CrcB family protein [Myxococcota bacterium]
MSRSTALVISVGAALGALAREVLGVLANGVSAQVMPWGTLGANLAGAFLLGLMATHFDARFRHALFRPFWEIGFIRSFTTMSTFSLQSIRMLEMGAWEVLLPYVLLSVLGGLIAVWFGEVLGRDLSRRRGTVIDSSRRDEVEREL